jgi:hypothetical protein
MRRTVISYKTRPDAAAVNEELLRGVFDELARVKPDNVRWTALVLEDGVSFIHTVEIERGENPIPGLTSFKRYSEAVLERCAEQPAVNEAREIGTYRGVGSQPSSPSRQPER